MRLLLAIILLLILPTLVIAQNTPCTNGNWNCMDQLNSQRNSEVPINTPIPTTTTFSVEIPNEDVLLTTMALCYSTDINFDMTKCNGEIAKKVVIEFIKEKIDAYAKSQLQPSVVNIQ